MRESYFSIKDLTSLLISKPFLMLSINIQIRRRSWIVLNYSNLVYETLKHQEHEMSEFYFKKIKLFCEKWDAYIELRLASGVASVEEVLDLLFLKSQLTEEEKLIMEEYNELKKILDDYS